MQTADIPSETPCPGQFPCGRVGTSLKQAGTFPLETGQDIQHQLVSHAKTEQAVRKGKRFRGGLRKIHAGMSAFPFRKGYEGNFRIKTGQGILPDTGDAVFFGMSPQIGECRPVGKIAVKGNESQNMNRCHLGIQFSCFVMVLEKAIKRAWPYATSRRGSGKPRIRAAQATL